MKLNEQPIIFPCAGEQLLGIIAQPEQAKKTGVLIVVGGPQYRVGSHRQFLLLSRALASAGYPVMRFDYRGMGDSEGELRDFQQVGGDIAAAIEAFFLTCSYIDKVVIWGLCDAASASLLYLDSTNDARVSGLVLLNPWVRSEATLARAHIKHYYGQRLLKSDFWRKLLTGKLDISRAIGGLVSSWNTFQRLDKKAIRQSALSFQGRMLSGLKKAQIPLLLILSGEDYVAKEFLEVVQLDQGWQAALEQETVLKVSILEVDHTFSSAEWRRGVEQTTKRWLHATFKE